MDQTSLQALSPLDGRYAAALRLLRGETTVAAEWDVAAVAGRAAKAPPSEAKDIEARTARSLPPLIKGYWRLGARFSRDAVVDEAFGTTDVLVVLPVEDIRSRYLAHFAPAEASSSLAA